MKKLISVFAALALVGSMAAAPKKPAAPAAKPAVAAPAPVAAVAASMPKSSGKGIGLFIEGRGSYSLSNGSSTSQGTGDQSATAKDYLLSNAAGFGGGGTIGFNFLENLGVVASFDYRSVKSRKWEQTNQAAGAVAFGDGAAVAGSATPTGQTLSFGTAAGNAGASASTSTGSFDLQNTKNTMIIGLGLRPTVNVGPGYFYAGAGAALLLPYTDTTTANFTGSSTATVKTATGERAIKYNLGIGAYGELGYNFNITDNLYVGLGARLVVITSNNSGQTTTYTASGTNAAGTTFTATSTYANGTSTSGAADVTSGTTAQTRTGERNYASDGTTDISATINVGVRF